MKKFTLIELLVVIAIIGILSSILLPSLSDAREKGISSVCISNLKQSQIQTVLYTDDNQDLILMHNPQSPWYGWSGALLDQNYLKSGDKGNFCPKTQPDLSSSGYLKRHTYGGNFQALYKQTAWANRSWMIYDTSTQNYYKRLNAIPKTSEYVFLADSVSKWNWDTQHRIVNHSAFGSGDWAPIFTTHDVGKKANISYADGHAKTTPISELRDLTDNSITFDYLAL
ncbi:MAG: prepilin-type N-terminal cleavage/methylation domain-containing protein [Lentisphaerales bacterium]|nr:prepilin-type N-terminal cleavage/methylation domain-containing protein [Lentisphaerales bacterium]